jgi:hypothetical protein
MAPPKLPPTYVNLPPSFIYDAAIPDGPARTLCQIYGLFWNKDNPPKITFEDLMELSGKSRSTLYGHLAYLRSSGWLPFSTAADGTLDFDLSAFLSKFSDSSLLINTSLDSIDSKNGGGLINGKSEKLDKQKRDPLLDHEAIKAYRHYTHLTANWVQRQDIAARVVDVDAWGETIKHWLGHGWSPTNLTGMIESYQKGGRAVCSLCQRANGKSIARPRTSKLDAEIERLKAEEDARNGRT